MVVMPVVGCPPSNHPLLNVDKPVVGRLTVWWCANTWLGVHFVMVGAYLLLGEGNNKKRNPVEFMDLKNTRKKFVTCQQPNTMVLGTF